MMLFTCSSADWSILSASSDICSDEEVVDDELMDVDDETLWLTDEKLCTLEDILVEDVSDTRCSISECASFWELSSTRLFTPISSTTWLTPKHSVLTKHATRDTDLLLNLCWWKNGFRGGRNQSALSTARSMTTFYQQLLFWKSPLSNANS